MLVSIEATVNCRSAGPANCSGLQDGKSKRWIFTTGLRNETLEQPLS